ncbi:MAG: hypothetical protein WBC29_04495 [Candidatus Moraniibacteriota bacterium]
MNGTLDLGGVTVTVKSLDAEETVKAKQVETDSFHVTNTDPDAKTLGAAIIPKGETSVVVKTTAVGEGSRIFAMPETVIENSLAVSDRRVGKDFTISLSGEAGKDVPFSWWILEEIVPEAVPEP